MRCRGVYTTAIHNSSPKADQLTNSVLHCTSSRITTTTDWLVRAALNPTTRATHPALKVTPPCCTVQDLRRRTKAAATPQSMPPPKQTRTHLTQDSSTGAHQPPVVDGIILLYRLEREVVDAERCEHDGPGKRFIGAAVDCQGLLPDGSDLCVVARRGGWQNPSECETGNEKVCDGSAYKPRVADAHPYAAREESLDRTLLCPLSPLNMGCGLVPKCVATAPPSCNMSSPTMPTRSFRSIPFPRIE